MTAGHQATLREAFDHFEYVAVERPDSSRPGSWLLRYRLTGPGVAVDFTETINLPAVTGGPTRGDGARPSSAAATVPSSGPPLDGGTPSAEWAVVRLLWLAAGLSYYKAGAPPVVTVFGGLTPCERTFLTELIRNGLTEFAYVNDLPAALTPTIDAPLLDAPSPAARPDDPAHRHGESPATAAPADGPSWRMLVPVGGGKDSIVSVEALRAAGAQVTCFSVGRHEPIDATARTAGLAIVRATRQLSAELFELNRAGAWNGHVPVTAVNSLIAVLTAQRAGLDAVVMSNERSASVGNTVWQGVEVNHQWSKSVAAETLMRHTLQAAGCEVEYFSLLRPLSELAIMRAFARHKAYFSVFRSCNRAFRLDLATRAKGWCADCPKCRFVFLGLAPFVDRDTLVGIFGRDMLADPTQRQGFAELVGVSGHKPLECVGEVAECRWALARLAADPAWADAEVVAGLAGDLAAASAELHPDDVAFADLFAPSAEHFIPASLQRAVDAILGAHAPAGG